jgi:hypothetical protein
MLLPPLLTFASTVVRRERTLLRRFLILVLTAGGGGAVWARARTGPFTESPALVVLQLGYTAKLGGPAAPVSPGRHLEAADKVEVGECGEAAQCLQTLVRHVAAAEVEENKLGEAADCAEHLGAGRARTAPPRRR